MEGREPGAVLDRAVDERFVERVAEAAADAPEGDEVHEAISRLIDLAEQDPDGTREALWALRGNTSALEGLENGLRLAPDRATMALGGAIQLASTELASDDPDLRGRMPELVRWLEGGW